MTQLFTIENDKIVINKLALAETQGNVSHAGNLSVSGDLAVTGALAVDTLHVKNIVTDAGNPADVGQWSYPNEEDLNGKGFSWTHGSASTQLVYRTGGRIWTNGEFDIGQGRSYKIDNIPVISAKELGPTIVKSNLREVGPLKTLRVLGDASLGDFAFFNSTANRLGLNTDEPNAALSVVDNDVEVIIGSNRIGVANIGTHSNHTLELITDNIPRIVVKNNGEVHIGDPASKSGVLKVHGTLEVETIISDTRIDRFSPLEFKTTRDSNIYGKGLVWSGTGVTRYFTMEAGPDRLRSSESIDVAEGQCYRVNGKAVINENSLGDTVSHSNLTKLGALEELIVNGAAKFYRDIEVDNLLRAKALQVGDGLNYVSFNGQSINGIQQVSLTVQDSEVFYADQNEIAIGNKLNNRRPVKVFGQLTVGVNNPDPDTSLAVNGNISFANKKFITGANPPTSGSFVKGDICWNTDPKENNYVGWVCINEGTPGEWLPFGAIGRQ
jgi:hypothetical protein